MKKAPLGAVILLLSALLLSAIACGGGDEATPTVPPGFTTYTDESSLFSISYPHDWEPALYALGELEEAVSDVILGIESDVPIDELRYLFLGGLPDEEGLNPNVLILVEPLPIDTGNIDSVAEAEVRGIKGIVQDYREFSRTKTSIDGREAVIIDIQALWPGVGGTETLTRALQMYAIHGKNVWGIACTTDPDLFASYADTFHDVIRSFRILR
jgi:hypothetical protein